MPHESLGCTVNDGLKDVYVLKKSNLPHKILGFEDKSR